MAVFDELTKICETRKNVSLKNMCSIHIGGIGKYVCFPKSINEVYCLLNYLTAINLEYYVFGNGTNIVFEDGGYNSVLICMRKMQGMRFVKNNCYVLAGTNLLELNNKLAKHGLGGMEWSYGIPGTVGGAICMNAGAFAGCMANHIKYVWVLCDGKIKRLTNKQMHFDYRSSIIQHSKLVVLKVLLTLEHSEKSEIKQKQNDIFNQRLNTQPYGTINAGSVFKKTNLESAGKIIDKLGLKGVKIGDIQISSKHANFFINLGNGTSEDLHNLINFVKIRAKQEKNIFLQEEIMFVGNKKGTNI